MRAISSQPWAEMSQQCAMMTQLPSQSWALKRYQQGCHEPQIGRDESATWSDESAPGSDVSATCSAESAAGVNDSALSRSKSATEQR